MAGYYILLRQAFELTKRQFAPRYFKMHERTARYTRRNRRTILETIRGADPNAGSGRVAIFVHFDRGGILADYVVAYLESLKAAGFRIWLMSNAPRLPIAEVAKATPLVAWIHRRNNFGFDFGAYKDGIISAMDGVEPDQLLLCNDSVYGPFRPLTDVLATATPEGSDVWGMTESFEMFYHLQSYFVLFHRRAVQHPAFLKYWQDAPYVDARGWLIHHGEVGLTQTMLRNGLQVRSLYPNEAIAAVMRRKVHRLELQQGRIKFSARMQSILNHRRNLTQILDNGLPLNPTHFFWDILIQDLGYPFIKRDLLQLNPARIPEIASWRDVISGATEYDINLIRNHLLPRLRHRTI